MNFTFLNLSYAATLQSWDLALPRLRLPLAMPWYRALPTVSEYIVENGWAKCFGSKFQDPAESFSFSVSFVSPWV
ncbi:hypothetical protein ACFX13_012656 [Malus domestica]